MYLPPSRSRRMGSTNNGTVAVGAPNSYKDNSVTHLLRYSNYLLEISYNNVVGRCGNVIIPYTSV